ncbi:protease modulator HflC [Frigidibacter sp. RF13]|uniref:protease modulator HflC n=1 Tax=Frigidibacter sp. RF13 TaxID=2997340 RepID=UPI00226D46AA|nr:protease modulator HflC [Frigidibacter sp. RF13]MCY1126934.1 protease modulator HflC [Frigidibacter sp. RF13]
MNRTTLLLPLAAVLLATVLSSVFIVDEREKALVLQLGQIQEIREEPGLYFKVPLIQEVVRYDDRILGRDIEPLEVTPSDDRRLVVDAFARYRIVDVKRFRQATGAGGESFAENRIDTILRAQIREVLGGVDSSAILSENRAALALQIRDAARTEAAALGVEIVDVRLRRTDLPEQNLEATFARMRAERQREAADQVARGNEAAQRLRAAADRAVIETVSDARRQAEIIRGEADAKRTAIFANAYGADPEFFDFYRSLAAYRASLLGDNSTLVIAPDSEFFDYLRSSTAGGGGTVAGQ